MINLNLTINGVDRSSVIDKDSVHVHDTLSARNTMEFTMWDLTGSGSTRPVVGQTVVLLDTDGVTRLFAGTIDSIDETLLMGVLTYLKYDVHCVDFNQICDRFLVAESFISPTQTLRDIVTSIVTNILAGEGISTSNVQTGPVIPETKVFNYKTVTQVFNELQTLTNYVWWIDYNKFLYFAPRTGMSSATTLDTTNCLSMTVTTTRANGPYRNRQYVRAGTAETSSRTELLTGDGKRKTYNTAFDIERGPVKGDPPTILLNSVAQTVGLHGVDTGKQFYWEHGTNQVTIDDGSTALSSTDVLSVTYVGRYPSVVQAQVDAEIADRMAIEGGTGVYESLKTDRNLNDLVAQQNLATSLLARYGFIPKNVKVVTQVTGLRSGQLVTLSFSPSSITGTYLIQSVQGDLLSGTLMQYTVDLVNG